MLHPNSIKVVKQVTSIYPDRNNAKIVECITTGPKGFEYFDATVKNTEIDLSMYLKTVIFQKLKDSEREKLLKLIDEYGDQRYEEGNFDASYEG